MRRSASVMPSSHWRPPVCPKVKPVGERNARNRLAAFDELGGNGALANATSYPALEAFSSALPTGYAAVDVPAGGPVDNRTTRRIRI